MKATDPKFFEERRCTEEVRTNDPRDPYQRDRARIIHSAAFRRLQGKTQVMGVGEGDFHRTRLTHSIECAQIGYGLLDVLQRKESTKIPKEWLPERDLIEAACFAHDLGHPPFGHGGEKALHQQMWSCGGFEGNGQTLRIITRLEKYKEKGWGINPTRRLILAILKYPIPYGKFDHTEYKQKPPKCYFNEEQDIVEWALEGFCDFERAQLLERNDKNKAKHRSFDSSLMELADDIAYGVHDIEDIVARKLVDREEIEEGISKAFSNIRDNLRKEGEIISADSINKKLFNGSFERKQIISCLVNVFVSNVDVAPVTRFEHPLLAYRAQLPEPYCTLLTELKKLSFNWIIKKPEVQQLEQRGQRIVVQVFEALKSDPKQLIPQFDQDRAGDSACKMRRICDYVAGMTDGYADKIYRRLFIPGFGSSNDEL